MVISVSFERSGIFSVPDCHLRFQSSRRALAKIQVPLESLKPER